MSQWRKFGATFAAGLRRRRTRARSQVASGRSGPDRARDDMDSVFGSTHPTGGPLSPPRALSVVVFAEGLRPCRRVRPNSATQQVGSWLHVQFHRGDTALAPHSMMRKPDWRKLPPASQPYPGSSPLGRRSAMGMGQRFAAAFGPALNDQDGAARAEHAVRPSSSCCDVPCRPSIRAVPGTERSATVSPEPVRAAADFPTLHCWTRKGTRGLYVHG
jgi:hypothetical protein